MRRAAIALGLAVSLTAVSVTQAVTNGKKKSYQDGGVILRMSEPTGTVFSPGEELSFSYQTQHDAYVLVFNIDSEGYVQLITPAPGDAPRLVRAQQTVAIPGNGDRLLVEGDTGIEFQLLIQSEPQSWVFQILRSHLGARQQVVKHDSLVACQCAYQLLNFEAMPERGLGRHINRL